MASQSSAYTHKNAVFGICESQVVVPQLLQYQPSIFVHTFITLLPMTINVSSSVRSSARPPNPVQKNDAQPAHAIAHNPLLPAWGPTAELPAEGRSGSVKTKLCKSISNRFDLYSREVPVPNLGLLTLE
jgi:hypothetical protein